MEINQKMSNGKCCNFASKGRKGLVLGPLLAKGIMALLSMSMDEMVA